MKKSETKMGLGLAALGRPEYINVRDIGLNDKSKTAFKKNALAVLDEAYRMGIRYFDTAPSYGNGEAFLKEWNDSNTYKDAVLGTKWGYTYMANWELGYKGKHEIKAHSLEKLLDQWQVSKKLLPNLKYYQVHSATFESGILKNENVLNQLQKIKKATGLRIGITTSGENQKDVIAAAINIKVEGTYLFDVFQVTYNVFEQDAFEILKKAILLGKTVIIKEALANGRVFSSVNFKHYKLLNELSKKRHVGIDAIALRFVIDNLQPTYVLSGASNKTHLAQNFKALDFRLSKQELESLKNLRIVTKDYWNERNNLSWN